MTFGVAAGCAYVVLKAGYVGARLAGASSEALDGAEEQVTPVLLALSIAAIVAGVVWPGVCDLWLLRQARAAYQHARLRRLWLEVTGAVPEVSLDRALLNRPGVRAPRRLTAPWEAELLLYRRLVEILDGLLVLRQYTSAADEAVVRRHVGRAAPSASRRPALIDRVLLELALAARATGAAPSWTPRGDVPAALSPMQEVRRLRAINAARGAARPIVAEVRDESARSMINSAEVA